MGEAESMKAEAQDRRKSKEREFSLPVRKDQGLEKKGVPGNLGVRIDDSTVGGQTPDWNR